MLMKGRDLCGGGSVTKKHFGLSIIKSDCGKKIHLSPDLLEELGNPSSVELHIRARSIWIVPSNTGFIVKSNGMIYNTGFVNKLIETFKLKFTTSSLHFKIVRIRVENATKCAEVTIVSLFDN